MAEKEDNHRRGRRKGDVEMFSSLETLNSRVSDFGKELKSVLRILNGNGDIGLVAEVKANSAFREKIEEFHTDIRHAIIRTVIRVTVSGIISIVLVSVGIVFGTKFWN